MKKLKLFGTILFISALIVSGCGSGNAPENVVAGKKDDPVFENKEDIADGSLEHGDGYGFDEFDLDIEIDGKDAIDIGYDVTGKAEAEYKNELTNVNLDEPKAMDEVDKLFIYILITEDTPEDVVIEKILEFLRIDNYSKFELEVNFNDGTTLKINDSK